MVKVKNAPGKRNCCCNDCGVRPRGDAKECCYCACDQLCATVSVAATGTDSDPCDDTCGCLPVGTACDCVVGGDVLAWNSETCVWEGTVFCGELSIDLEVEIKLCNGECKVCVTSACLGLTGDCNGNGCYALADCGEYLDGCASDATLVIITGQDVSGCGDSDCVSADIVIRCQSVVNPQPEPPICRDCDCVCECICLTYTEGLCAETQLVCWDADAEHWQATFADGCPFGAQTITITLVADGNNCCHWHLEASRGNVDGVDPASNCPRPSEIWTLNDLGATVELECSTCDECEIDAVCCPNDLPDTLYARICGPCGTWCVPLAFAGSTATTSIWKGGPVTIQCTDGVDIGVCYDLTLGEIEFECLTGGSVWQINILCGSPATLVFSDTATVQCDPFCASVPFGIPLGECGYTGFLCIDSWEICISERPC